MAITRDDHVPSTITKTRIAPTPSGYLHLGNAFSFALTAALAEKYNARIVLRIDDLDQERVRPAYVQDIFDTLDFLEIGWHEGPRNPREVEREYSQIHRLDLYRRAFDTLISQSAIFACNCSRARVQEAAPDSVYKCRCIEKALPLDTPEVRWRLRTSTDLALTVRTLDGTINAFLPPEQQNFIVRGTDLWPSTLAQHYLAKGLSVQSFLDTTFHHHALFTAVDGTKLSKSAGATSIQYLRKAGKTRADVYNLIARHAGIKENVSGWKELFAAAQLSTNHG
jgi:glutamyl-tRNA synthetase